MLDIIQLLPDSIANQIAAGEVVQRPSSVVKELMENAIDAESKHVQLIIKDAGKSLVQVIDDGIGMSETDARMCFERHATSKLRRSEDLFSIRTMGFRGEALASIAAVAQVELKSRRKADETGTCISIEGSEFKSQEAVAAQPGTAICVKNLFFNVPARRNFLKSNAVEMRHIVEEFQRIALAHPETELSLYHNDAEIYKLPAGKLSHRIVGLFGKNYKEQMAACQEETPHVTVRGYVGKPQQAKKTRGEQFFFVNNRFIKNGYLHHAVMNAFEGLLPENSFPFYVLFIEMDPKHIDINVHPTKTEIKFDDERTVYAIVRSAIKQALGMHNIMPSLNFDEDVNFQSMGISTLDFEGAGHESHSYPPKQVKDTSSENKGYEQYKGTNSAMQRNNQANWEKLFEESPKRNDIDFSDYSDESEVPFTTPDENINQEEQNTLTFESAANQLSAEGNYQDTTGAEKKTNKGAFQIHNRYIVSQVKSGMMLIDQQAAHERILFEKYLQTLENKNGVSQQFLFPQTIELNPVDFNLVMELSEEIKALGFLFEEFGQSAIVLNGIPADVAGSSNEALFEGLLEQFKQNQDTLSVSKKENMARSMAKRAAIKAGQSLESEEIKSLIDQLFACATPNYAPNGQLIFSILSMEKLAGFFK